MTTESTRVVVEIIQLALTPVFLIVGIGTILNVVTGRVARVIDRARWYATQRKSAEFEMTPHIIHELKSLDRRLKLANWSINFLVAAAVVLCLDIIMLMVSGLVDYSLDSTIIVLFMLSISFITGGFIAFLTEVTIASATLKIHHKYK